MGTVSQLGFMVAVFGWGTPEARSPAASCCSPTRCSRPRRSWSSGSSTTSTAHVTPRLLPRPGPGWGWTSGVDRRRRGLDGRRAAVLGFVAKEGVFDGVRHRAPWRGAGCWPAVVVGSIAHRRLQPAVRRRRARRMAATGARRRRGARTAGDAGFARPGRASWPPLASCSAWCPACSTSSSARRPAPSAASTTVHLALWHGVNLPLVLSLVALAGGAALFVRRGRVERVLASGPATPVTSPGSTPRSLRGMNTGRRPGHRRRPVRLAARSTWASSSSPRPSCPARSCSSGASGRAGPTS